MGVASMPVDAVEGARQIEFAAKGQVVHDHQSSNRDKKEAHMNQRRVLPPIRPTALMSPNFACLPPVCKKRAAR